MESWRAREIEKKKNEAKQSAAIDKFLVHLARVAGEETLRNEDTNFNKIRGEHPDEFQALWDQLIADIRHLIPSASQDHYDQIEPGDTILEERLDEWQTASEQIIKTQGSFRIQLQKILLNDQKRKILAVQEQSSQTKSNLSLQSTVLKETLRQLRNSIEEEQSAASFACGGIIPIVEGEEENNDTLPRRTSSPINLFWAVDPANNKASRVTLARTTGTAFEDTEKGVEQLTKDCSPASFGRGGEDILDPSYRKAGKLELHQFASTFHPSDFGIIENIQQILLPSISSHLENKLGFRKLIAELYKLNVYSGPSGHFRKHVDTPRSSQQVGSLVVCLPSSFTGGNLLVRHHGQEIDFDWSAMSGSSIQWAAFYSDCEHEILTIKEGARITLTYNLYVAEPVGHVLAPNPIVDPQTLPLYQYVKTLLEQPGFMEEGGVLGVFCSHAYAHSSKSAALSLPRSLKGSDLAFYAAFKSLGYSVEILPVLGDGRHYHSEFPELGVTGQAMYRDDEHYETETYVDNPSDEEDYTGYSDDDEDEGDLRGWKVRSYLEKASNLDMLPFYLKSKEYQNCDDLEARWKLLFKINDVFCPDEVFGEVDTKKESVLQYVENARLVKVGKELHSYFTTERGEEEDMDKVAEDVWPFDYLPGITWLTEPKHEERAFTHLTYGNQAGVGTRYSCAAMLVVVSPLAERLSRTAPSANN